MKADLKKQQAAEVTKKALLGGAFFGGDNRAERFLILVILVGVGECRGEL